MSFSNDDDKDGLAALFGGITPQRATPPGDERAAPPAPAPPAPAPPAPEQPVAEQPAPQQPAPQAWTPQQSAPPQSPPSWGAEPPAPRDPGLEPSASAPPPPAFPAPSYQPPSYEPPAAPPAAYEPPTYQPPAAQPQAAEPPAAAPVSPPPAYRPPAYDPPTAQPPTSQPPTAPPPAPQWAAAQPTAAEPPAAPPPTSAGYDLPAPASPPTNPAAFAPPSQPPAFAPPAAGGYDLPAPTDSGRMAPPPTAQYPTGMPFPAPVVPPPYVPTASDTPRVGASDAPATPAPLQEPPVPGGFDSLGLADRDEAHAAVERSPYARPTEAQAPPREDALPSRDEAGPSGAAVSSDASERPVVRVPTGALLPAPPDAPPIETPEELARPTTFEKVGLVAAILTGPIGLVLAIVTAAIGARRRGWVIGLTRAAIVLGILSTIGVAIGGVALWNLRVAQLEHAEVAAASAQFCAAAAENPAIVEPPLLGWPDPGATIPESLTAMQEWTTRWTELIPVSPEALRPGLEVLAARGQEIVTAVETSRLVDDEANSQLIRSAASQSGVANWHATYCVAP